VPVFDGSAQKGSNTRMSIPRKQLTLAMTGASGAAYGLRLMQRLAMAGAGLHVLISDAARVVLDQEQDLLLPEEPEEMGQALARHLGLGGDALRCYALNDWFAPCASGSAGIREMVVVPCSMGTLARIATGTSDNLIERAADVVLKERGRLVLVPRETPLSSIHLEHMLTLSRLGVHMIPAMPGFYHRPDSIEALVDFVVDRVIDHLGYADEGIRRWGA
jgi:4-hydroxy-3-polyprenylbenzoate decarboxylase